MLILGQNPPPFVQVHFNMIIQKEKNTIKTLEKNIYNNNAVNSRKLSQIVQVLEQENLADTF